MSRRGLGLAVVASLAVLALATTIATVASAQPPRHVDHDRAEPSQAVLVATTQGMVDAGANGLEATLAGEEPAQATQQGQRAAQLGGFLAQAAATSTRNVSLQPLLATLGPIGAQMGPSLHNLTQDGHTLFHANATGFERTLAWLNASRDLATAETQIAALADEDVDVDTQRLAEAIATFRERFQATPEPQQGGLHVDPRQAFLGQRVSIAVLHPAHANQTAHVLAFGENHTLALDEEGMAQTRLRVPFSTPTGTQTLNVTWPGGHVGLPVEIQRVPTAWAQVQVDPPGDERRLQATLVEDLPGTTRAQATRGVPQAAVEATLAPRTAVGTHAGEGAIAGDAIEPALANASLRHLEATTGTGGQLGIGLGDNETGTVLAYPGNRTHAEAHHAWLDPWETQPAQTGEQGDELADLFERAGTSTRPEAPEVAWTWAGLVLAGVAIAIGLEAEQAVWRDRWAPHLTLTGASGRPVGSDVGEGRSLGPRVAVEPGRALPASHPVAHALDSAGYDADRVTLREAAEILEGMGAPEVQVWAVQHERAYYLGRTPPPVPPSLRDWAEGLP